MRRNQPTGPDPFYVVSDEFLRIVEGSHAAAEAAIARGDVATAGTHLEVSKATLEQLRLTWRRMNAERSAQAGGAR